MDFLLELFGANTPPGFNDGPPVCPDCHKFLTQNKVGDVPLLSCPNCLGAMVDLESFERIGQQPPEVLASFQQPADGHHTDNASHSARACPVCGLPMVNFLFRGELWLDWCQDGHGMWLDRGELALVHRLRTAAEGMSPEERLEVQDRVTQARNPGTP